MANAEGNRAAVYIDAHARYLALAEETRALIESTAELRVMRLYGERSVWPEEPLLELNGLNLNDLQVEDAAAELESVLFGFRETTAGECDWGFDFGSGNLSTAVPHLKYVQDLVNASVFSARFLWQTGDRDRAALGLVSLQRFAMDVGADGDGGLISLVVRYNIERVILSVAGGWLDSEDSAIRLRHLAEPAPVADRELVVKALKLETQTVLPLARRLISSHEPSDDTTELFSGVPITGLVREHGKAGLLEQLNAADEHYDRVVKALRLDADAFPAAFKSCMRDIRRTRNYFSSICLVNCPGIERVYWDIRELEARWRLFNAAIQLYREEEPLPEGLTLETRGDVNVICSDLSVNGESVYQEFPM